MKRFMNKKLLVVGVAVALVLGVGGAAFAYFSSTGSGTGSAGVGTSSNLIINQIGDTPLFNSLPNVGYAQDFEAHGLAELGSQITLAPSTSPLDNVVVSMANFGPTAFSWPITLNIYNVGADNAVGSLIAKDTQTFAIPEGGVNAPDGIASTFDITFNFGPQDVTLPGTVIYGVAFSTGPGLNGSNTGQPNSQGTGLGVGLSYDPSGVTVGSDPVSSLNGADYIDVTSANGGGYGDVESGSNFCDYGLSENVFQYDPGPCTGGEAINYDQTPYLVPAVQFNAVGAGVGDLYPGGASQPINFTVTNPGGGDEYVSSVTITISSISQTPAGLLLGTCNPLWFGITQPTAPVDVTITPGGTYTYDPSGASIALGESHTNQDMCQGATVNLAFTSS